VAQRLAAQFPEHRPQLIAVNPLDVTALREEVERYLKRTSSGSIGLNYTGGTKVMAVHSYQAVEHLCKGQRREVVFSYLDADTLELTIEPQAGRPAFRRKVVQAVELSIPQLFDLHDIRLLGQPQTEPLLPDLTHALAQMHYDPTGIQAWQSSRIVLQACDGRLWREVKAELLNVGATADVVENLQHALGLSEPEPVNLRAAARQAGLKSPRELSLWLDGVWLEDWGLACIKALGYRHRGRSLTGLTPSRFEIDVAVMRGYQLFALSCSVTTDRTKAKG